MAYKDNLCNEKEKLKIINLNNKLIKLKSDYFLQNFFSNIPTKIKLEIIKYNKGIQKRLNININNYKEYSEIYSSIEVEIIPKENIYNKFINIDKENEKYFHIYFNNNKKKEINKTKLTKKPKVKKINIIIDYHIKSFYYLFFECYSIESIYFKKFYRNNINNMSYVFYNCRHLKEINLSNFNTKNVTDMRGMFGGCKSLKELNLSNFDTHNVTDMRNMFGDCSDELILKIRNQYKNFLEEAFE